MEGKESDLIGNPKNPYIILILGDMKVYNFWRMQQYNPNGSIHRMTLALDVLFGNMPPHGQSYMKEEMQRVENNGQELSYAELQHIYKKAVGWLWKHFLSALYNPLNERYFEDLEREDNSESSEG